MDKQIIFEECVETYKNQQEKSILTQPLDQSTMVGKNRYNQTHFSYQTQTIPNQ